MNKKIYSFILILLLLFFNFSLFSTSQMDQNWKKNRSSFTYDLNVKQTFSFNLIIGFLVIINLDYLENSVDNISKFELSTYTKLTNYAGTETVTGYEDLNTRLIEMDYSNTINLNRIMKYFGFSNQKLYNPFSIPKANFTSKSVLKIWNFEHSYTNSSMIKYFNIKKEVDIFTYKSSSANIQNVAMYEKIFGVLIFSQFKVITPDFNISAELKLSDTNLFSKGDVSLFAYLVVGTIFILIPSLAISLKIYKIKKEKKVIEGGLN